MAHLSEKTMFEIYREAEYNKRYRVIYYTESNFQKLCMEHVRDRFDQAAFFMMPS